MSETVTLNKSSESIEHLCSVDERLAALIGLVGNIKYRIHSDPYDFLIGEILEQMLSVKAADKIYQRLLWYNRAR